MVRVRGLADAPAGGEDGNRLAGSGSLGHVGSRAATLS